MDWSSINDRLENLTQELAEEGEDEVSDDELNSFAEAFGVDPEELLQASEEDLTSALEEMKYRVMAHPKYGRAGLKSKHPWAKNEKHVGYAIPTQGSRHTGAPSHRTAKVPKQSGSPMFRRPAKHRRK